MTFAEQDIKRLIANNELIINEIRKGEPSQSEVFSSLVQELRVVYEGKDYSVSTSHTTSMYGVRCITNGRMGFMTTNSDDPEMLKAIAKEVQSVARLSTPNEHNLIAAKPESFGHFETVDPKLGTLTPADVCNYADIVVKEALRDPRVSLDRAEFTWSASQWALSNSNGFSQSAAANVCSWYVMGMARAGSEVTSFDYDGGSATFATDLESEISRSVGTFRDSVVCSLNPKKGKTYRGPVLLHPQAVMDLIGGFVSANCNGLRHQDNMSSWKGRVGEEVASSILNVYEDPLNNNRPEGWQPFDREGNNCSHHNLIEDGKLNFIGHNSFSAHRENVKPTGNATGGARSIPGIGFANLSIGGSRSKTKFSEEKDLYSQLKDGLVLKRFSGNSDPISGNFSGVAKNSWWAEKCERGYPVHEVMVSGNLFELLKQIKAEGKTQYRLLGGGIAPYLLVDGISVTS